MVTYVMSYILFFCFILTVCLSNPMSCQVSHLYGSRSALNVPLTFPPHVFKPSSVPLRLDPVIVLVFHCQFCQVLRMWGKKPKHPTTTLEKVILSRHSLGLLLSLLTETASMSLSLIFKMKKQYYSCFSRVIGQPTLY